MSTRRTDYVMFGVKFDKPKDIITDDEAYEKYHPLMDNTFSSKFDPKKVAIVYDGMCGQYLIVGYILAKGDYEVGMPLTDIHLSFISSDINGLKEACPEIAQKASELLDSRARYGLWAFTHWS